MVARRAAPLEVGFVSILFFGGMGNRAIEKCRGIWYNMRRD